MDETHAHGPQDAQDAFEQLARLTLADNSMATVMHTVAELSRSVVPGADEVSVTLVEQGRPETVAATGALARQVDEEQYALGSGPCLDGIAGGSTVEIPDIRTDTRWPVWAQRAARLGAASSLSIPIPLQREVAAAINIYSTRPDAFSEHGRELAATFAAYAGVAIANMHLYETQGRVAEQLQTAMQSRAVIEQAKGILMGQRRCSAEHAFDVLVELSQHTNRKLREVAQALVDSAVQTGPGRTGGSP